MCIHRKGGMDRVVVVLLVLLTCFKLHGVELSPSYNLGLSVPVKDEGKYLTVVENVTMTHSTPVSNINISLS